MVSTSLKNKLTKMARHIGCLLVVLYVKNFRNMPNKDFYDSWYDFEVVRPVTKEEIDKDPDRWHGYEVGWTTNAFETKAEIIKIAKKVAAARFPGWKFIVENE
jgi:hypothetical protein